MRMNKGKIKTCSSAKLKTKKLEKRCSGNEEMGKIDIEKDHILVCPQQSNRTSKEFYINKYKVQHTLCMSTH